MNTKIVAHSVPDIKPKGHPRARSQESDIERSLRESYRDQRLTDSLEILERQGFRGDSAIFILSLIGGEA